MTSFVAALGRTAALAAMWVVAAASGAQGPHPDAAPAKVAGAGNSVPALGRLQIFDDWAVACDNRLTCTAVSLIPDGAGTAYAVLVTIRRAAGPDGAGVLQLIGADELRGKFEIIADNRQLAKVNAARDVIELTGAQAITVIRALGSSYAFEIRQKRRAIDAPSLHGLPAVLRYMDEQQGRVGSKGALAALGDAPADTARPVPSVPSFPAVLPPGGGERQPPPVLGPQEIAAARRLAVCEAMMTTGDYPPETHVLDGNRLLVLLPCNAGAYNVSTVPLVASGAAGSRQFSIARFDHVPGLTGEPGAPPLIVNARWNPARGELSSLAKGRGLGDCGTAETYRWDGSQFRLVEARSMPVCRGAWEWPILYSAMTQG